MWASGTLTYSRDGEITRPSCAVKNAALRDEAMEVSEPRDRSSSTGCGKRRGSVSLSPKTEKTYVNWDDPLLRIAAQPAPREGGPPRQVPSWSSGAKIPKTDSDWRQRLDESLHWHRSVAMREFCGQKSLRLIALAPARTAEGSTAMILLRMARCLYLFTHLRRQGVVYLVGQRYNRGREIASGPCSTPKIEEKIR